MRVLKVGSLYFAFVFGAGFMLGTVRVLWVLPRFGERIAELIEAPIMLAVIFVAARWIVRRFAPLTGAERLVVGMVGLGLLLCAEFTVVLGLRGLTIGEYFASRDPVSGTVYVALLGAFAIMPTRDGP